MKNFRTYDYAVELYHESKKVRLPYYLKDQLLRAASSVVLNLAEGNNRLTTKDRLRFFNMALTSAREVEAIFDLEKICILKPKLNRTLGCLYRLCYCLQN